MAKSFFRKSTNILAFLIIASSVTSCSQQSEEAFSGKCEVLKSEIDYWQLQRSSMNIFFTMRQSGDDSTDEYRIRLEETNSILQGVRDSVEDAEEIEALDDLITINGLLMRYWDNPERFDLVKLTNYLANFELFVKNPVFDGCS